MDALIESIREIAGKKTSYDDDLPEDTPSYAETGNYDDAYLMGVEDGKIEFARHLNKLLNREEEE